MSDIDPPEPVIPAQAASKGPDVRVLAKGAGVTLIGSVLGRVIHLATQVILARFLGPAAFGLYGVGWTVLRMVGLVAPLGLDTGVLRYASMFAKRDQTRFKGAVIASVSLSWASGLVLGVLIFLLAPWLADQVFRKPGLSPVLRWLAVAVPFYAGLFSAASATRASQDVRYAVYTQHLIRPAILLTLFLGLFAAGWKLMGAVLATTLAFVVSFGFAIYYLTKLYPELYQRRVVPAFEMWSLLAFSLPAALGTAFTSYVAWIDRLMVAYYLPAAEVGVYQAASQVSVGFALITGAFNTIFGPVAARLYGDGEIDQLNATYKVTTKWGLYLSLPLALFLLFVPGPTLQTFFGGEYVAGSSALVILVLGQVANVAAGSVGLLLLMSGHPIRWFTTSAIMLVINFLLNVILVPRLGLPGAAIAASASLAGLYGAGLIQARMLVGVWPYDRRYLKGLAAAALTVVALFASQLLEIGRPTLHVAVAAAVAGLVFFPLIFVFGLDHEDRQLGRLVMGKLRSRRGQMP